MGPYPEEKCCCCFEILCGIKVIAALSILGIISNIWNYASLLRIADKFPGGMQAYIWIGVIISLVYGLPIYYYITWLMKDNKDNRNNLVRAQLITIILIVVENIWRRAGSYICFQDIPAEVG